MYIKGHLEPRTVQALLDHVLFKHGMRNTDYSALPKYYPSGSNVHKAERVTVLVSAKNIGTDGALSYNNTGGSCWSAFKPCHHQLHRGEMTPALHNISVADRAVTLLDYVPFRLCLYAPICLLQTGYSDILKSVHLIPMAWGLHLLACSVFAVLSQTEGAEAGQCRPPESLLSNGSIC